MKPEIVLVTPENHDLIEQMADILTKAFRIMSPTSWTTVEEGLEEIHDLLKDDNFVIAAIVYGQAVGLIGGIPEYDGNVYELHPLAVHPDWQNNGIGRQLVAVFEAEVIKRGGMTIMLGSDDEANMTSLSGVDMYKNMWDKVANIRNFKGHPYEFYQKQGYQIVGIIPDANGFGKPDILMAKRVGQISPKTDKQAAD